jgi:hypothetical protein
MMPALLINTLKRLHSGIRPGHFSQMPFAPPGYDYLVPALVQRLGQAAANSRSPAGNEDRVPA